MSSGFAGSGFAILKTVTLVAAAISACHRSGSSGSGFKNLVAVPTSGY